MNYLDQQIEAYGEMKSNLEAQFMGKWVLIHDVKKLAKNSLRSAQG